MKRFTSILMLLVMLFLAMVPVVTASAESNGQMIYVSSANGKGVRLRATEGGRVICNLGEATKVTVLSVDGEWSYVHAEGHNTKGYVMNKFLSYTDPCTLKQRFHNVKEHTVTVQPTRGAAGYVNLRAKASKNAASIAQMFKGEQLTVVAESRAFYKVYDKLGNVGYVVKAYVR